MIQEKELELLSKMGLDPDVYGFRPVEEDSPKDFDADAEPTTTAMQAAMSGFRQGIGPAVGSLTAMALFNGIPAVATWGASLPFTLGGSILAGIGGGVIGGALQDEVEPVLLREDYVATAARKQKQQQLAEAHPGASYVGQTLPYAIAFRPSPKGVLNAVKGLGSLGTKSLTGESLVNIAAPQKAALANLAINAGSGAGMSAGHDVYASEKSGFNKLKDISLSRMARDAAVNALVFNESNLIGRKVFGFRSSHPPGVSENPMVLSGISGGELPIGPVDPYPLRTAIEGSLGIPKRVQDVYPAFDHQQLLKRMDEIPREEASKVRAEDFKKAVAEVKETVAEEVLTSLRAEGVVPEVGQVRVAEDVIPAPKVVTELGKEVYGDFSGVTAHDENVNLTEPLSNAELLQNEIQDTGLKYQNESGAVEADLLKGGKKAAPDPLNPKLPVYEAEPFSSISLPQGKELRATLGGKESALIRRENADVSLDDTIFNPEAGKRARGSYDPVTDKIALNPEIATRDTLPHEIGHGVIKQKLAEGGREGRVVQKWIDKFGSEEALIEEMGHQWVNRTHKEGEGFKSLGRDLMAAVRTRFKLDSNLDAARLLSRKLSPNEATFTERTAAIQKTKGGVVPNVVTGNEEKKFQPEENSPPLSRTATIHALRPAVRTPGGEHLTAEKGVTHNDLLFSQPKEWVLENFEGLKKMERGFTPDNGKTFLSRREVSDMLGEKYDMQSERLRDMQKDTPEFDEGGKKYQNEDETFTTSTRKLLDSPEKIKITPDKNGKLDSTGLAGRIRNSVPPIEIDLLERAGFFKHLKDNPKISPDEVKEWLNNNGPRADVHTYGMDGKVSAARAEYDSLSREFFDNQLPRIRTAITSYLREYVADPDSSYTKSLRSAAIDKISSEVTNKEKWISNLDNYAKIAVKSDAEPPDTSPRATPFYTTVSPLSVERPMPEWTTSKSKKNLQRVDVVIPVAKLTGKEISSELSADGTKRKPLFRQDDQHENLPNTLVWAAIQYETGPNGEKIAHIFEAQSRWEQTIREAKKQQLVEEINGPGSNDWSLVGRDGIPYGKHYRTEAEARAAGPNVISKQDHPLLKDYNRLILKAAIEQARKEGATHIAISDGETAMMSEGHDSRAKKGIISQEDRMRIIYDTILPKMMEELTGSKGEVIELGQNKNAFKDEAPSTLRDNLVFKNPDGTPKTSITSRLYPLAEVAARRNTGEPFSLAERRYQTDTDDGMTPEAGSYLFAPKAKAKAEVESSTLPKTEYNNINNSPEERGMDSPEERKSPYIPVLKPEVEKIRSLGKGGKVIASTITKFYEKLDKYTGHFVNTPIHELHKLADFSLLDLKSRYLLNNKHLDNSLKYMHEMKDNKGTSDIVLTDKEQQIVDLFRAKLREIWHERNSREGLHHSKTIDENYVPEMISAKVADTIFNKPHSKEAENLRRDLFKKYIEDNPKLTEEDAIKLAKADLVIMRKGYAKDKVDVTTKFGPLDDNAGKGLPESWRETSLLNLYNRFFKRVSRRFAYNDTMENNSAFKEAFEGQDSGAGLMNNESVKTVMNDVFGFQPLLEPNRNAISGVIRAAMLGTLTGSKDYTSNYFLGMQHETPGQTLKSALYANEHFKKHLAESREAGVNQNNIIALEMGDNENTVSSLLSRTRDTLATVQGRNWLERMTRAIAYGKGKFVAMDNLLQAHNGTLHKTGEKFLNDFSGDGGWKQYVEAGEFPPEVLSEIAARYTRSLQGSYNYTDLPAIAQQGSLAPFLSLSRWSIGKLNNYQKFVVHPMLNDGNYKPFLMSTLGMIVGGTAINEIVELATGRKERTPTIKEIVQAFKDKDGKGILSLTYKLAALANLSGYAGFLGDVSQGILATKFSNKPNGLNNVLIEGLVNGADIVQDLVEAINSDNPITVADVSKRVLTDYIQIARLGYANFDTETKKGIEMSNKRRDLKVYKTTHGKEVASIIAERPNVFMNTEERKFKRADSIEEADALLPGITEKIRRRADGDRDEIERKMSGLKRNSYQTVPNPRINRRDFDAYMKHIEETQGKEAADELVADYNRRNRLNKLKSKRVPKR